MCGRVHVCVRVCVYAAALVIQVLKFADTPVNLCICVKWLVFTPKPVNKHVEVNMVVTVIYS